MRPYGFSDEPRDDPDQALVHLLPVPLELTVSYGGGTARGPEAILEASYQLENYDREFECEPGPDYGIYTWPALQLGTDEHACFRQITQKVKEIYQPERLLGVLGGEHSLTAPVVNALLECRQSPLTVVQIDAHCDLRQEYEGNPLSHACVSRRLLDFKGVEQVLQLGIRSLCTEEADVLKTDGRVRAWFAEDVSADNYQQEFCERLKGKDVYLTLDVDGFDPSIMPSTGTPEPAGLSFQQALKIVRLVTEHANLVAFDCVELAPIAGFHAPDFMVAKFLYRLMNLRQTNRS